MASPAKTAPAATPTPTGIADVQPIKRSKSGEGLRSAPALLQLTEVQLQRGRAADAKLEAELQQEYCALDSRDARRGRLRCTYW